LEELEQLIPHQLKLYVTFMKAFRGVVEKCLRMQLAEDWEAAVVHFSATLDLMKETFNTIEGVKFHIIRVYSFLFLVILNYESCS
jgi:hypothetical protein